MRHNIFSNLGVKIASLAIAVVVWLSIINVSNPVTARTITGVPISITNGSYIESMDLSYRIADGYDTISVTVRGNRSVVERLTSSSVTATADLTQIIDLESDPVMVPLTVSVTGVSSENITASPANIPIVLEDIESADFVISATTGSTTPATGYEVGSMSVDPERITVRGPASVVDRIGKIQAEVDVSNIRQDKTITPTLHIYDKNEDELSDTYMSYLSYNIDESSISVEVELYEVVSDIAIEAETYGEPADGYQVGEITVTPSTISLAGSASAISNLEDAGNTITITSDSQAVDVTGATSDVDISVNLPDYLASDLRVAEGLSDTVVVSVKILEYDTTSIELSTKSITRNNLEDGYTAVFSDTAVDIRVKASSEMLDSIKASDITASVDLSGLAEGDYDVPVSVVLPDGYTLAENVTTPVTISRTVTTNTETDDETTDAQTGT